MGSTAEQGHSNVSRLVKIVGQMHCAAILLSALALLAIGFWHIIKLMPMLSPIMRSLNLQTMTAGLLAFLIVLPVFWFIGFVVWTFITDVLFGLCMDRWMRYRFDRIAICSWAYSLIACIVFLIRNDYTFAAFTIEIPILCEFSIFVRMAGTAYIEQIDGQVFPTVDEAKEAAISHAKMASMIWPHKLYVHAVKSSPPMYRVTKQSPHKGERLLRITSGSYLSANSGTDAKVEFWSGKYALWIKAGLPESWLLACAKWFRYLMCALIAFGLLLAFVQ